MTRPDLSRLRGLLEAAMKEYPRGLFIGVQRVRVLEELPAILDRLEAMTAALEFYADGDNYVYVNEICGDAGERARRALGK
jgi:hypothetical protein